MKKVSKVYCHTEFFHITGKWYFDKGKCYEANMEGGNHNLSEYKLEANDMEIKWFDRFVKNSDPLPDLIPHGK